MIAVPSLFTFRLDMEYDGTEFAGWQHQKRLRTVQGVTEDAVRVLFGQNCRLFAAGRTDAGVHASGQVAHFRTSVYRNPTTLCPALNANLPKDVRVLKVSLAKPDFHARFSARWRGYEYRIARKPQAIGRQYAWFCPRALDIGLMNIAAAHVVGSMNFSSFSHSCPEERHYLSDVYLAVWSEDTHYYRFTIVANRFLHGMVRLLVGTFVNVGRGKIAPQSVLEILREHNVQFAGPKAPARGLTLSKVGYAQWPDIT